MLSEFAKKVRHHGVMNKVEDKKMEENERF